MGVREAEGRGRDGERISRRDNMMVQRIILVLPRYIDIAIYRNIQFRDTIIMTKGASTLTALVRQYSDIKHDLQYLILWQHYLFNITPFPVYHRPSLNS